LKCKIWHKLDVKARCAKKKNVSFDFIGQEDTELVSEIFDKTECFENFVLSFASSPQHFKKLLIWKMKIYSESQMGQWFQTLVKCYKAKHFAEVQFHSGVFSAPATPMEVSFYLCRATSWVTRDILEKDIVREEIRSCEYYSLKVSFKVSCSRISYSDSE